MDKVSLSKSSTTEKLISDRDLTQKASPKKKVEDDGIVDSMPDYVVSITAEKLDEKSTYSPQEVKSKAKAFLASGSASPEERAVLSDILSKK